MAQHDYDIANGSGAVVRADINAALDAVASNNSGATAPSTTFAHQWWFDETANQLKQRNAANTAWVIVASKVGDVWTPFINGSAVESGAPEVGEIRIWSTNTPPAGWLLCSGQAVSRATHSALFTVVGETYGNGDGSTTFNLPDLRGRVPLGAGTGDTAEGGGSGSVRTITSKGGAETHTQVPGEIATHQHDQGTLSLSGGSTHSHGTVQANSLSPPAVTAAAPLSGGTQPTISGDTGNAGNADPMDIMNPFLVMQYMIYSGA